MKKISRSGSVACLFLLLVFCSNSMGMEISVNAGVGRVSGELQSMVSGPYTNADGTAGGEGLSNETRFPLDLNVASLRAETRESRLKMSLEAAMNIGEGSGRVKEGAWEYTF